ncbi:MAG: GGDEF domain-containing protein [Lachnospiraceae bacterium]|nr:GGDEF domain-containing protein [Lachnospiraceae bacterium]
MKSILYSENLRKFSNVFKQDVDSALECFEKINENIYLIADDLHLGRFDIRIDAPASLYDSEGYLIDYPVYSGEKGYSTPPMQFPYETYEHGHILIRVFPQKDYQWNEQEKEELDTLARNVFFICGRARLIELMKKIRVTDNMTGIANLQGFHEFVDEVNERGELTFYHAVCVNIKNFNFINRTIATKRSNETLREYARYVEQHLKEDEIFARTAGDNFLGLIHNENVQEFLEFISKVNIHADTESKLIQISSRTGVYDIQVGDTVSDIKGYIEAALNMARQQNEDVVFFEHSMMEQMLREKEISAIFPMALKREQFEVYYQPKVNINDQAICGCEALVRWYRNGKMIMPLEFIPVLEREGTICSLDFYVLEKVCKAIKSWTERGLKPVRVSSNFSKVHLKNPSLADKIFSVIERYGVDPQFIEIELTEMSGYDNYDNLALFIKKMRERGVHTSIDDFGTGYSSLNLLTDLDVDTVKLDKSYSIRLDNEEEKTKILVRNIVNMVHDLGFKVIAEGVETEEQADFLREIGCSTVQGYLYDKPLPLDQLEKRLEKEFKYTIENKCK